MTPRRARFSAAGQGGEVQIQPQHFGLSPRQVQHQDLRSRGRRRPVGTPAGGRHLPLPALPRSNDCIW